MEVEVRSLDIEAEEGIREIAQVQEGDHMPI